MLVTVFFYHLARLFIKLSYVTSNVSVWEGLVVRSLSMSFFFMLTILIKNPKLLRVTKGYRCLLLTRCIVGMVSFTLLFVGLKYLTYSTSMIFYFLYPLFTSIFARIFLKEDLSPYDIIAICISLFGVSLFAFP